MPAEIPMQIAVSILSPVSIQILIPAFLKDSKVNLISSYNKSSTPVIPINSIFFSKWLMIFVIFCSRFRIDWLASSYLLIHCENYLSVKVFLATTSVRSPYLPKSSHYSVMYSEWSWDTFSFIMLSAPFK